MRTATKVSFCLLALLFLSGRIIEPPNGFADTVAFPSLRAGAHISFSWNANASRTIRGSEVSITASAIHDILVESRTDPEESCVNRCGEVVTVQEMTFRWDWHWKGAPPKEVQMGMDYLNNTDGKEYLDTRVPGTFTIRQRIVMRFGGGWGERYLTLAKPPVVNILAVVGRGPTTLYGTGVAVKFDPWVSWDGYTRFRSLIDPSRTGIGQKIIIEPGNSLRMTPTTIIGEGERLFENSRRTVLIGRISYENMNSYYEWDKETGVLILQYEDVTTSSVVSRVTRLLSTNLMRIGAVLSISVHENSIEVGDLIRLSGNLTPPPTRAAVVSINYTSPQGSVSRYSEGVHEDGTFSSLFRPYGNGTWIIQASWEGDEMHPRVVSDPIRVEVRPVARNSTTGWFKIGSTTSGIAPEGINSVGFLYSIGAAAGVTLGIGFVLLRLRKRKSLN